MSADGEQIKITFADNHIFRGNLIGKTRETNFLGANENIKIIPTIPLVKAIELE